LLDPLSPDSGEDINGVLLGPVNLTAEKEKVRRWFTRNEKSTPVAATAERNQELVLALAEGLVNHSASKPLVQITSEVS
jgi:hypothetical protein